MSRQYVCKVTAPDSYSRGHCNLWVCCMVVNPHFISLLHLCQYKRGTIFSVMWTNNLPWIIQLILFFFSLSLNKLLTQLHSKTFFSNHLLIKTSWGPKTAIAVQVYLLLETVFLVSLQGSYIHRFHCTE